MVITMTLTYCWGISPYQSPLALFRSPGCAIVRLGLEEESAPNAALLRIETPEDPQGWLAAVGDSAVLAAREEQSGHSGAMPRSTLP